MYVTISRPSDPRGGFQGDNRIYLSSPLAHEIGEAFVIRTTHEGVYLREAMLSDRDARSVKRQTSFRSPVEIGEGRHKIKKSNDKYFIV